MKIIIDYLSEINNHKPSFMTNFPSIKQNCLQDHLILKLWKSI